MTPNGNHVARCLVRLYPAAFRDRWGAAVELEAQALGWRAWPSLVAGVADMWLHPTVWPARSAAQRHRRAASAAVAVTSATWLLVHAIAEQNIPLPARPGRAAALDCCVLLMLLGLALVVPRPRLIRGTAVNLLNQAVRRLAGPVVLGASVVVAVRLAPHTVETNPWRPIAFACWWLALALGAAQTCRTFAVLDAATVLPPHPVRLQAGLWILTTAVGAAGSAIAGYAVTDGRPDPLSVLVSASLLLLASALLATARDLRDLRPVSTDG